LEHDTGMITYKAQNYGNTLKYRNTLNETSMLRKKYIKYK